MVEHGRISIMNTGRMRKMDYEECPKCHQHGIEIIVIGLDYDNGIVNCKLCFNKMKLKDYYYWKEEKALRRGEEE